MTPDDERFAVASAHPLSTSAGMEVLRAGGNAYDAALAVSAALPVVQPHMNGLGSDFFAVVRDGHSTAVNACGPAAQAATIERLRRLGCRRVPSRGPLSALTVPGLVAAWPWLVGQGRLGWKRALAPAIRLAALGFRASPSLARAVRRVRWGDRDFSRIYRGVVAGETFRQPDLAKTLAAIAQDGGHGFYHGALARRICRDLSRKGGLLEPGDLAAFRLETSRPLRVRYREHTVETNPPPSQGATALIWLNLLARERLDALDEEAYLEALVRTMRIAYRYRARYIGDPRFVRFPSRLLRPSCAYRLRDEVAPLRPGTSDTTAFSVYDGDVGISAIQSNYGGFGSGLAIQGTGITLNNRGSYFTLNESHPNVLAPGKRTFHTLMATVVTGPRTVLLGSMGGDVQPQVNVQVLTRHLDRGMALAEAIAAPRFAFLATIYGSAELYREAGVRLRAARVLRNDSAAFGHAQGISVGARVEVGVDPRGDGLLPLPS